MCWYSISGMCPCVTGMGWYRVWRGVLIAFLCVHVVHASVSLMQWCTMLIIGITSLAH